MLYRSNTIFFCSDRSGRERGREGGTKVTIEIRDLRVNRITHVFRENKDERVIRAPRNKNSERSLPAANETETNSRVEKEIDKQKEDNIDVSRVNVECTGNLVVVYIDVHGRYEVILCERKRSKMETIQTRDIENKLKNYIKRDFTFIFVF